MHVNFEWLPSLMIGPTDFHRELPITPAYLPIPTFATQVQSLKSDFVAPIVDRKGSPSMSATVQTDLWARGAPSADINRVG